LAFLHDFNVGCFVELNELFDLVKELRVISWCEALANLVAAEVCKVLKAVEPIKKEQRILSLNEVLHGLRLLLSYDDHTEQFRKCYWNPVCTLFVAKLICELLRAIQDENNLGAWLHLLLVLSACNL
jgi:hypothetical protein